MRTPFAFFVLSALPLSAQTITVDTVEDQVDFAGSQRLFDLPGPDGLISFREALTAANNTPGPQTIAFAIPSSGWFLFNEYAALKLENGAFLVTDDATTIDFSTQTAFTGDTNPNGMEVGIYGLQPNGWGAPAIYIGANDCVVRGLGEVLQRGPSISIVSGQRNRIVGCVTESVELDPYPGSTSFNVIGGTDPEDGCVLDAIDIFCGADDNLVIGNVVSSVSVVGSPFCAVQHPQRNRVGGPTAAERNVLNGAGYYSSEGFPSGYNVKVDWAQDTLIEGNYIGISADGLSRVPQVAPTGIDVRDSIDTTIRDNVIAGMRVVGINHYAGEVYGRAIRVLGVNADDFGTLVQGNTIGLDALGLNALATYNGIEIGQLTGIPFGAKIGGTAPREGNTIGFVEQTGVAVIGAVPDTEISGNSIFGSGLLGIDLGSLFQGVDGVTPNDPGDVDTNGGNELQNFPVLTSASAGLASVTLTGFLESMPGRSYRLEFFSNQACDSTGFGEGQVFLGSTVVTTNASGQAPFAAVLAASVSSGRFVSATATELASNATSEFGACVRMTTRPVRDRRGAVLPR